MTNNPDTMIAPSAPIDEVLTFIKERHQTLNATFRLEWIARLRSGNYQQGEMRLRASKDYVSLRQPNTETWCCIGIACDIVRPGAWQLNTNKLSAERGAYCLNGGKPLDGNELYGYPPPGFLDGVGMDGNFIRAFGRINDYHESRVPVQQKYSFNDIADLLEEHTVGV